MTFVDFRVTWQRIARMQIKRHVQALHRRPERPELRQVVIDRCVGVINLRKTVDQRAPKTKLLHAAFEFSRRPGGVLHRQRGQALKAVWPPAHLFGEIVVGSSGNFIGLRRVRDSLHRGRVERQQRGFDPVLVHQR